MKFSQKQWGVLLIACFISLVLSVWKHGGITSKSYTIGLEDFQATTINDSIYGALRDPPLRGADFTNIQLTASHPQADISPQPGNYLLTFESANLRHDQSVNFGWSGKFLLFKAPIPVLKGKGAEGDFQKYSVAFEIVGIMASHVGDRRGNTTPATGIGLEHQLGKESKVVSVDINSFNSECRPCLVVSGFRVDHVHELRKK